MPANVSSLMYHDVLLAGKARGGIPGTGGDRYAVDEADFLRQLDEIERRVPGPPLVAGDLTRDPVPDGWTITFDDGGASAAWVGERLHERGWHGHFFLISDRIGTPGFLGRQEILDLAAQGHVIGSHSASHPAVISNLKPNEIEGEWRRSVEALSELTGAPVEVASVPGGYSSPAVEEAAAAAGIKVLFTSNPVRRISAERGLPLRVGRFAVRAGDEATTVAEAAAGKRGPWLRQDLAWKSRAVAKRLAGPAYRRIRARILG